MLSQVVDHFETCHLEPHIGANDLFVRTLSLGPGRRAPSTRRSCKLVFLC